MAEPKKTTKTSTPKSEKPVVSVTEQLAAKRQDLFESRRSHRAGELVNPRILRTTRKEIARLMTAKRAAELAGKEGN